ncbi:hypothetical protein GMST_19060 [Geomonas silvestris]|uniref:Lipoprotein n=1 Tax=Geomonas silvestris TaxID=2740184 RepID=A0A6V8MHV2_9BACT|nr:hypothetical protein [Geomonas silvestris]GFO59581.1 hypothetical protein GMST_19060 [Geomonas silvestris]
MKTTMTGKLSALLALALWATAAGCSSSTQPPQHAAAQPGRAQIIEKASIVKSASPPSEAQIVQAIDASGAMRRADGSFSVIPPIKVAQLGKQGGEGGWPVKARFQLKVKGREALAETTSSFRVFLVQEGPSRQVWKAELGT